MGNQVIVGPLVGAVIGFVVTWLVLDVVILVVAGKVLEAHVGFIVLIVCSGAGALLVAPPARRNRTIE